MKWLIRNFVFITGWLPQLIALRPRRYFTDRKKQGRHVSDGAIVISNHTSLLDFVLLMFTFSTRTLHFLVAEVMYKNAAMKLLLNGLGGIRVDRTTYDMSCLSAAERVLKNGGLLNIFPEGHLCKTGKTDTFRNGFVYLALKTGVPIIPVYCKGHYSAFKMSKIIIGEKLNIRDFCPENPTVEQMSAAAQAIRLHVENLGLRLTACEETHVNGTLHLRWFAYDLLRVICFPYLWLFKGVRFHYLDKAVMRRRFSGNAVIVCNHVALSDPIFISFAFPMRRIYYVAAEVLFQQNKMLALFMYLIGSIKIDRQKFDVHSFNRSVNVLRAGGALCVFPEGHISLDGSLQSLKGGAVLYAQKTGAPIIPMYMTKGRHRHIIIGTPFYTADISGAGLSNAGIDAVGSRLVHELNTLRELSEAQSRADKPVRHR